jgi:hypothetical protein
MIHRWSVATWSVRLAVPLWLLGCAADDGEQNEGPADTEAETDRFPCGNNGGSCELATEVCVIGGEDMCSTCAPRPAACDADATCGCLPPGTDPAFGAAQCIDAGSCAEVDGGLVLTCDEVDWGCG